MRLRDAATTLRASAGQFARILRGGGREYVPHPLTHLFIEPTTHCNLACRFCTYRLDRRPSATMGAELFADTVSQALAMGFEQVVLTPINGDAFVDKGIWDKLRFLDGCDGLGGIQLYSNFIALDARGVETLAGLRRLSLFNISVYGHDLASFTSVSGRGETQFRRLLANLETLAVLLPTARRPDAFQASLRVARGFDLDRAGGPLADVLRRLRAAGMAISVQSRCDDWGGLIGEKDMTGLGMDLVRGRWMYKRGACILPFHSVQVLADGRVNACACRDVGGSLQIGDMRTRRLADILSPGNEAYAGLIRDQQAGRFPPACRGCSFYRSILDPAIAGASPKGSMTVSEFWRVLGSV